MKLWFIITPKGNPALFQATGLACAAKTRKACIEHWCWDMAYGGITETEVWADWRRIGYRCERREVWG